MRQRGVAVRLRTPKLVYSHRYVGPAPGGGGAAARAHLDARVGFRSDEALPEDKAAGESAEGPRPSLGAA